MALLPLAGWAQTQQLELTEGAPIVNSIELRKQETAFNQLTAAAAARAAAACTNTTTLDFAQRPVNEDWKNHAPVNAGAANTNTTITTAGSYIEPVGGTETTLRVSNNGGTLNGQPLFWFADYTSSQNATTQITFSFNRPVNNFSLRIQDIDLGTGASGWIDEVTFAAAQANGVVLNLSSASDATYTNNAAYNTVSGNKITGIQNNVPNSELASVTVTFNKPIVSFQITYRNKVNLTNPGGQFIGIDYMSWCTQANVATTLSGPARAIVGTQVTYIATTTASGDYDASGVQSKVQLSPGLNSQSPVFPAGSSYNNVTGVLTLQVVPLLAVGASSTSVIKFNMPASTVTGTASSTINTDDADPIDNNGSLAAAKVTTTTNAAPTAAAKSANVTRNTAVFSALPAMTGTDPNGDVLTYTIVGSSIANINFGTVYYTRGGVQTTLAGTSNVTLTAEEALTLEFKNTNGVNGTSGAFSYFVSDSYGGVSPAVNYTITIGDQRAVYSSPNVAYAAGTVATKDEVIATVSDPDGTITGARITAGILPANLKFNVATGAFTRDNSKDIPVGKTDFTVETTGTASGTTTGISVTIEIISADTEALYSTGNTYNRDALTTGSSLATVTDADGGVTAATLTGAAATGISFNTTTGQFTVNSVTVPFAGTYTYSVNTTDAANGTTVTTTTITIRDDVEAAYTSATAQPGAYANGYSLATVTDADGSVTNATLSTSTLPAGVGLNTATGQFTVIDRTLLQSGTYIVQVRTTDATGGLTLQDVAINIGARPLPVSLVSFTAKAASSDAKLNWATASEKNNDHFDVERSLNGTDFVKIGQVKGQGSTSAPTDYALTDAGIGAKASGTVYYRLQQVDTDGTATYSPVRTVAFTKGLALAPAITLFPNPATTTTKLDLTQLPTGTYQVSLLDATGRVVLNTTLSAGLTHGLNLNSLASGTYTVLVHGQNGSETINLTKRLIKE